MLDFLILMFALWLIVFGPSWALGIGSVFTFVYAVGRFIDEKKRREREAADATMDKSEQQKKIDRLYGRD